MKSKRLDLLVVLALPVFATIATVVFSTNLLVSILLYFGLPSLYLCMRNKGIVAKSLRFSAIFFIPLALVADTIAATNGAYVIATTVFSFRILGISTVELYIYAFFWILFAVLFYEHFFDKGKRGDGFSMQFKYLMYILTSTAFFIVALFYFKHAWLYIPYCYFILASFVIFIPVLLVLARYTEFIPRFSLVALYFFYFMMLFELAALYTHQWLFPGQFVGWVSVLGQKFPFEELFFWMIFGTPAILVYYEFFADDRRL